MYIMQQHFIKTSTKRAGNVLGRTFWDKMTWMTTKTIHLIVTKLSMKPRTRQWQINFCKTELLVMQLRRESHFCISQARLYCRKIIYMVYLVEKSILYCNYLKPSWTYSRLILISLYRMTELSEYIYPYTSRPSTCFRKANRNQDLYLMD